MAAPATKPVQLGILRVRGTLSVVTSELIDQLDPDRDYGERGYEDVVRDVEVGSCVLNAALIYP